MPNTIKHFRDKGMLRKRKMLPFAYTEHHSPVKRDAGYSFEDSTTSGKEVKRLRKKNRQENKANNKRARSFRRQQLQKQLKEDLNERTI